MKTSTLDNGRCQFGSLTGVDLFMLGSANRHALLVAKTKNTFKIRAIG